MVETMPASSDMAVNLPVVVPMDQYVSLRHGQAVPANIIYTSGNHLLPALPDDPDLARALTVRTTWKQGDRGKCPNGLTRRADVMARLMARGAGGTSAYRAAYNASGDLLRVNSRAERITRHPAFWPAVNRYRDVLSWEAKQQEVKTKDLVMSILVREAQHGDKSASRIKAAELLGKTEGMFVTVSRSEKTLAPSDLKSLKTQLEQRLMQALGRLNPHLTNGSQGSSLGHGTDITPQGDETASAGPHPGAPPLFVDGSHPGSVDRTLPKRSSPLVSSDTPGYILVPVAAREMTENDL